MLDACVFHFSNIVAVNTCECVIFKVDQIHPRENMDLLAWSHARDTQLSNGPIGASIRVREVPIQQCQRLTSPQEKSGQKENCEEL